MGRTTDRSVFVPIVLTADQAKAAASACAMAFTAMRVASLNHPVFTAALAIEDAMVKAGAMDPLPRHAREN